MFNTKTSARRQRGQGMTEYIIIVALIAIAAIGVYNEFGKTVRDQTSAMAEGLAGSDTKSTKASTDAGKEADASVSVAIEARGLANFGKDQKEE